MLSPCALPSASRIQDTLRPRPVTGARSCIPSAAGWRRQLMRRRRAHALIRAARACQSGRQELAGWCTAAERTDGHDADGELGEQAAAREHAQAGRQAAALAGTRGARLLLPRLGPRQRAWVPCAQQRPDRRRIGRRASGTGSRAAQAVHTARLTGQGCPPAQAAGASRLAAGRPAGASGPGRPALVPHVSAHGTRQGPAGDGGRVGQTHTAPASPLCARTSRL